MPYTVKVKDIPGEKTQSPTQAIREVMQELNKVPQGEMVTGILGKVQPLTEVPKVTLNPVEITEKGEAVSFLRKVLEPAQLSLNRPNPVADRVSLNNKLDRMELKELKRFIPDGCNLKIENIPLDIKLEINKRYRDLSP